MLPFARGATNSGAATAADFGSVVYSVLRSYPLQRFKFPYCILLHPAVITNFNFCRYPERVAPALLEESSPVFFPRTSQLPFFDFTTTLHKTENEKCNLHSFPKTYDDKI